MYTCSVVNDQKIKSADALAISTNLLHITSNLFEYLKTLQSDAIRGETEERIERIYKYIMLNDNELENNSYCYYSYYK